MSIGEGGEEDLLFDFLNASDDSQLLHITTYIQQQNRKNESIQVRKLSKQQQQWKMVQKF